MSVLQIFQHISDRQPTFPLSLAGLHELQQAADGPEVSFVLAEEGPTRAPRPELHGRGQALHGHRVDAQKVAHKHHPLNTLTPAHWYIS